MSLSTHYLEHGRHVAQLRRRRRAYAPASNYAGHDNHEKISSWGLPLAAFRTAGAPLLRMRTARGIICGYLATIE